MRTDTPQTIYLRDYQPYPYDIQGLNLTFDIQDGHTIVTAVSRFKKTDPLPREVVLNGEDLELISIKIDGQATKDYTRTDEELIFLPTSDEFELEIVTKIYPEKNTRLEGLYKSGDTYCTQCEAQGFRRITYYPDRPDVLTVFDVRIEANESYPILLSNGNQGEAGPLGGGRHFVGWRDPFPKPCYLFALVVGHLTHIHDTFTTRSGREVDLYIYVRPGDESQCEHAMESLKKAMKWDEDTYGLEYELDLFNIVAVSDFNMGAMENTSLNIFNTALVLAAQETATDQDFMRVESVIAHEYFHNWSGNRVTCRDWFQLSLKEGLTVFRDQEFSADMNSRDVQRIDDVTQLRRLQFPEDAGPLAHPIRPEEYIEINNFYTMTVYEKGAEVIRMLRTILGSENYRKGTDLYFSRHDGQAVTCDDFVTCMQEASGVDLSQFRLWYSQAGTPEVAFKGEYDENTKTYSFTLTQAIPDTPGQTDKAPMHIPVAIGLLGEGGQTLMDTTVFDLREKEQRFTVDNIVDSSGKTPVASVLHGFSAPVKLRTEHSNSDLTFLMLNDSDGFNKWESGQELYVRMLNHMIDEGSTEVCPEFMSALGELLEQGLEAGTDKALLARSLSVPGISYVGQQRDVVDPDAIYKARQALLAAMKREHRKVLDEIYANNKQSGEFSISPGAMGQRSLRNVVLGILSSTHGMGCAKRTKVHYDEADNMSDRVAALSVLADMDRDERDVAFDDFYNRFKAYPLVVDKFFSLLASATRTDIIPNLKSLREHADFNIKNPNRVRSIYAAFAMNNPVGFHAVDGSGYEFLTNAIIELNRINPQIAARLLTPLREWKRYTPERQEKMQAALERILAEKNLSPDVYEIASKSLKA